MTDPVIVLVLPWVQFYHWSGLLTQHFICLGGKHIILKPKIKEYPCLKRIQDANRLKMTHRVKSGSNCAAKTLTRMPAKEPSDTVQSEYTHNKDPSFRRWKRNKVHFFLNSGWNVRKSHNCHKAFWTLLEIKTIKTRPGH